MFGEKTVVCSLHFCAFVNFSETVIIIIMKRTQMFLLVLLSSSLVAKVISFFSLIFFYSHGFIHLLLRHKAALWTISLGGSDLVPELMWKLK